MKQSPTALSLFTKAVSRQRERCTVVTEYKHANLAAYLSSHLPGYTVTAPAPGLSGISSHPAPHPTASEHAKELQFLATYLTGIPVAEAEDQYNGHCETCAVYATSALVDALASAPAAPVLLEQVLGDLNKHLSQLPWEAQVQEMFAAERRAREDAAKEPQQQLGRTGAMWKPLLEQSGSSGGGGSSSSSSSSAAAASSSAAALPPAIPTALGTVAASSFTFCAGSPAFPQQLAAAAASAAASPTGMAVMPCYILNYIYDGDELSAADLRVTTIETAQYSCHVVGLVLVASSSTCWVCDPNGALLPGGNMEFLSLPFTARPGKGSTAVSRADLDAQQLQQPPKSKKSKK